MCTKKELIEIFKEICSSSADLKGLANEFLKEPRSINIARKSPPWDLFSGEGFNAWSLIFGGKIGSETDSLTSF